MTLSIRSNHNEVIDLNTVSFSGGERHIQLGDIKQLPVTSVVISARINSTEGVMDLLLTVNALRHRLGKDLIIDLTLPYMPYARQDRVCATGQAFSLEVFATVLSTMTLRNITTWDCHSNIGLELTGAINVTPENIIANSPALLSLLTSSDGVLVCPDEGAKGRCQDIQNALNISTIV